jgi:zinc protease
MIVVEKPGAPVVAVTLLVKHGATSEPAEKKGVAALTAQLLTEGTPQRSGEQIAEHIAAVGGEFAADTGFDDTTIDWVVLKPDLTPSLEILADVVQHPVFPPDAVARARSATLTRHRETAQADPRTRLFHALFGDSAYGVPTWGETSTVARLVRADVVQFHRQMYRPEDTILAAVGDVTFEEFVTVAKTYFGDWAAAPRAERAVPTLAMTPTPRVMVVDRPLAQAALSLAFVGAPITDQDTPVLELLTHLLADGPDSRLEQSLREQHGWTYGVRSNLASFRQTGVLFLDMSVPYEAVLPALERTVRELACLRSTRLSAVELARAKQQAATHFSLRTEDIADLSGFIARYEAFHPEHESPERLLAAFARVTPDELQAAAQRYLNPQKMVVVIEGDHAALQKVAPNLVPPWSTQCEGQEETVP